MQWHIDFEIFSLILISILIVYYIKGKYIPTWQNRIYGLLLAVSFSFVSVNIVATTCLIYFDQTNIGVTEFFNNLYLVFLPMVPAIVLLYVISVVRQDFSYKKKSVIPILFPFLVCVLLALSNPFTHLLFTITKEEGYRAGVGYFVTYGVFFLYAFIVLWFTIKNHKEISSEKTVAIVGFLCVAAGAIIAQIIFPGYILTGAACACCVLFIHLSMQNQSFTVDELTGAYKRQVFLQILGMHFNSGTDGDIIAVALKDFKFANEVFGTKTCDLLLREVAQYLESISINGRVYRFDGDVFCFAIHSDFKSMADQKLDLIQERFKKPWRLQGIDYSLSCNMAEVPYSNEKNQSVEDIVSAIDFSIHEAKRYNGERIIRGDKIFSEKFKKKNHITTMLQNALQNDGFEVYYQPIYSIEKGHFATCEALLRMRDPEYGLIAPNEFIPTTEENGMIVAIGLIVFDKVCRFVATHPYIQAGFESIGVNLSVVQCMQENLADDLISIMRHYNLKPEYFKFEITETVAAGSLKMLKNTMDKLIINGSNFALDDFGIGYSGVTNMLSLPFKIIKLDKSLINKMIGDMRMTMTADTIITLIHRLEMRAIAEGVEKEEEVNLLASMECDFIQGFYFSKPLPEAQFSELVNRAAEKYNYEI